MTTRLTNHLSEEALNDFLIGLGTTEIDVHLARCAECREKVEGFQAEVLLFNEASLAWSHAQPSRVAPVLAPEPRFRPAWATLSFAAIAALLVAVAIPVWHRTHREPLNEVQTAALSGDTSEAQIAQDNDLLRAVDVAINSAETSPIDQYDLADGQSVHALGPHHKGKR